MRTFPFVDRAKADHYRKCGSDDAQRIKIFWSAHLLSEQTGNYLKGIQMWKAVLTDTHFWIPVVVLILGIALLVYLH